MKLECETNGRKCRDDFEENMLMHTYLVVRVMLYEVEFFSCGLGKKVLKLES